MRIVVEADLFSRSHSPEEHSALLSLFGLGLASHHAVEVRQDGSPAFRKWLAQRDRDTQALCERALDIGVKRSARRRRLSTVHVADIPAPSWKDRRLPVEVALKLASRPLTLQVAGNVRAGSGARASLLGHVRQRCAKTLETRNGRHHLSRSRARR